MYCLIDFETASAVDLLKAGAWRYAEDPSTDILCLGYSMDGTEPQLRKNYELQYGFHEVVIGYLEEAVHNPNCLFIAHNIGFEKAIWRKIMVPQYGWPDIPNSRWHCSQASCLEKALPGKLEKAGAVLRLAQQKDTAGRSAVTEASKFDKRGKSKRTPELMEKVYDYNRQDIRAELDLNHRVGFLQPGERNVFLLDQRVNERGVRIDLGYVRSCMAVVAGASKPLAKEFEELTNGLGVGQRDKVLAWVRDNGVGISNLQKKTITALIGPGLDDDEDEDDPEEDMGGAVVLEVPPSVRRALAIRRSLGSASIKKLPRFLECACADGRVRGVVQYHGAGTGRWAGRLFQPQNFPRESNPGDPLDARDILGTGDWEYVQAMLGDPMEAVIKGLRHAIVASPGRELNVGDFSTIEARIVLALAGQMDKVEMLARGESPYIPMAEAIYGRKIDKYADIQEYTIGKNTVLGCGFQMGWETFKARYCPSETREFAEGVIRTYRQEFAPEVPKLWRGLEEAACRAVWDTTTTEAYGVEFRHEDIWLTCRLHSGRKLYYAYPRPARKEMKWSTPEKPDIRMVWTCQAQKQGRWITRDMYGGLETENIVSGLARDQMVSAMFRCERENLPIVLTVHDEIAAEPLQQHSNHVLLAQLMAERDDWAKMIGIPVKAETWAGPIYRK